MAEPTPPAKPAANAAGCLALAIIGLPLLVATTCAFGGGSKTEPVPSGAEIAANYEALMAERERANPAKNLALSKTRGVVGGFGAVFILSGSIANSADFAIKDPHISCSVYGKSGTLVGVPSASLYEVIPANSSIRFRDLNMGFVEPQMTRYDCNILSASPAD